VTANFIESGASDTVETGHKSIRILVVDDHVVVRVGLKQLIASEFKAAVFGEAENGDKALELVRKQSWDVVLLDITMPGSSGIDVLKKMLTFRPGLPILILSMHPEDTYATCVLKQGAAGYVVKNSGGEELINAVRKALAGQKYVSNSLAEKLALNLGNPADNKPHEALSSRESQVLRLLGTGKSVKEISFELGLSGRTISTYRARLLEKMKFGTNAEIIRYTLLNHLVE